MQNVIAYAPPSPWSEVFSALLKAFLGLMAVAIVTAGFLMYWLVAVIISWLGRGR